MDAILFNYKRNIKVKKAWKEKGHNDAFIYELIKSIFFASHEQLTRFIPPTPGRFMLRWCTALNSKSQNSVELDSPLRVSYVTQKLEFEKVAISKESSIECEFLFKSGLKTLVMSKQPDAYTLIAIPVDEFVTFGDFKKTRLPGYHNLSELQEQSDVFESVLPTDPDLPILSFLNSDSPTEFNLNEVLDLGIEYN